LDSLEVIVWAVVAALTLVGEVLTVSFFLLFFTFGAVVGLVLALLGVGLPVQVAGFIVFSVLGMVLLRPTLLNRLAIQGSERYEGFKGITGRSAVVTEAIEPDRGGTVQLGDGEYWSARAVLPGRRIEAGSKVRVLDTDGIVALVDVVDEPLESEKGE
jgi:membrane protein implicated in regulation of membrane protease activity